LASRQITQRQRLAALAALSGFTVGSMAFGVSAAALAQAADTALRLDATAPTPPVGPADYEGGSNRAPDGSTVGVTDRYLTMNGKPWLPVMGEMHFTRVPESEWEPDILRMKAAGVNIISTYLIWIHHEEVEGQWDWSGNKNLRHFAELCQKHGMLLYPRLGPWAHGEARNGGLPDWVVAAGPVRQLDPTFMAETRTLYDQAGEQLRGLLWKDGGPVIGVQVENEYAARGAGEGAAYLLALKKMAIASGFDVPLYTLTGWDNAVIPPHAFIPVYGGYPDAPWGSSRTALPPQDVYAFHFRNRAAGSMGMIGAAAGGEAAANSNSGPAYPFLTAEIGGGMQDTYHRRLIVTADDIAAIMPVMLGSGVNLYGSYMFVGGQNPDGKLTTLEESQATHYPTDVPVKSYDFQAPIGEYGLERPSLRLLKNWDYFLNDFGSLLAPMPVFAPAVVPSGPTDLSVLRWSVRTDGHAGFLFASNYVRGGVMPARPHTRFSVMLPGGQTLLLPAKPVDIPTGAYFAWPFGLNLDGVPLRYGTAQLMARLADAEGTSFVFSCVRGVRCEVALEGEGLTVQAPHGFQIERIPGATLVTREPGVRSGSSAGGFGEPVAVRTSGGASVRLLLLSPEVAEDSWKVTLGGETRLIETPADVFADSVRATMRQLGEPGFHFALYPAPRSLPVAEVAVHAEGEGRFTATLPSVRTSVAATLVKRAGTAPPVGLGPALSWRPVGVAQAPSDATWTAAAARWSLNVNPPQLSAGVSNLFLRIAYVGDSARLERSGRLLDDDFFNGEPWLVGLGRYAAKNRLPPLQLEILPIRSDAPVYLPPAGADQLAGKEQTVKLNGLTITPQYQLQLSVSMNGPLTSSLGYTAAKPYTRTRIEH
jgi:hypothetical protein